MDHSKKERSNKILNAGMGYVPPHSNQMEMDVLGIVLLEKTAAFQIMDIVQEDTFYKPNHADIWSVIRELFKENQAINTLTVLERIEKRKLLSPDLDREYLVKLTNGVTSTADLEYFARKIEEKAIARRTITACNMSINALYRDEEDINDILVNHDTELFKARKALTGNTTVTPDYHIDLLKERIIKGMEMGGITGIPTFIKPVDDILGGFQKQAVYMIGARTRHGKSAVAAAFLYNAVKDGDPGVYFSMEMPGYEMMARMASLHCRTIGDGHYIPYSRIFKGRITDREKELVFDALADIRQMQYYIDDTPALTTLQLKSKTLKYLNEYGITSMYADYIQLMKREFRSGSNDATAIADNMAEIKSMAKSLNIPAIILSQIDRESEKNGQKGRPMLAQLKGSGGLEENTDCVMLLYRPEVADPEPTDEVGRSEKGLMYIDIAKHKMGETGLIKIPFDVATNYFEYEDFVDNNWEMSHKTPSGFIGASSFNSTKIFTGNSKPSISDIDDEIPPF